MTTDTRHYPSFADYIAIVLLIVFSALILGAVTGMAVEACMKWLNG